MPEPPICAKTGPTLKHWPHLKAEFWLRGSESSQLWWCWWLPAQGTHPASKSPFWTVTMLLGTGGAPPAFKQSQPRAVNFASLQGQVQNREGSQPPGEGFPFFVLFTSTPSPPTCPIPLSPMNSSYLCSLEGRAFNQEAVMCLLQKSNCSLRIHHGQALGWRPRT